MSTKRVRGGRGKCSRFPHPEQKPEHSHRSRTPGECSQRSENRPPHNNKCQRAPSSDAIAQPSPRNLKESVTPPEGSEYPPDRDHRETHISLDHGHRARDIHPVPVADHVGPTNKLRHH